MFYQELREQLKKEKTQSELRADQLAKLRTELEKHKLMVKKNDAKRMLLESRLDRETTLLEESELQREHEKTELEVAALLDSSTGLDYISILAVIHPHRSSHIHRDRVSEQVRCRCQSVKLGFCSRRLLAEK